MIKQFEPETANQISGMIEAVFDKYIGYEYSEQGNKVFKDFISPEKIIERFKSGNILFTYHEGDKISGMIEVRDFKHLCLFFVDGDSQQSGIGRKLFTEVLSRVDGKTDFLEVNSSPYAVDIYSRLGFRKTGGKTVKDGIIFIPMRMELHGGEA